MINTIRVDQIINYLLTNTTVQSVLSDRIYFGTPMTEPDDIYLSINIVSDSLLSDYIKSARLSFSFIGGTEENDQKEIVDCIETVTNVIGQFECEKLFVLGNFKVYKITEGNLIGPSITVKNRLIFIKDFLFSYSRIG